MLEISNLRQRIEYISQISKQRDLVIQNKEFNQDFNNIVDYISFCSKMSEELEEALINKYKETIIHILKNAFSNGEFNVISDIETEHRKNSFRFTLSEPVFKKVLNSLPIVGEDTETVKDILANYLFLTFTSKIDVDIENRIIMSDNGWRFNKVEELLIDYVLPSENKKLEEKETELVDLKLKWFERLFRKNDFLDKIKLLEKDIDKLKKHIEYINLFLQEEGLLDKFIIEYKNEVQKFMSTLSNYLEQYTGKPFFIQE